jgi:Lar family restriction alleviation protein
MTTERAGLLPCPFCGFLCSSSHVHERTAKVSGGFHYFVRCGSCKTEGPRSLDNKAHAVAKWNYRAIGGRDYDHS